MSEWTVSTLGEVCRAGGGFIKIGPFGSQLHRSDYIDDAAGIPVVMPKDMCDGRVDLASVARVSKETANRLCQHLLAEGDVVLARRGDVGRSAWIDGHDLPMLCGTGSIRIHLGNGPVDPRFFKYVMHSKSVTGYLEARAIGATMPNLNAAIVEDVPVTVPPREIQLRIAAILGSIDDLIENNQHRIALLEETARAIYREWFVRFRYPGHEHATFVDSPIGAIPEDWRVVSLGDVLSLQYGKALKAADRRPGTVAVVGSSGVVGSHSVELLSGPAVVVGRKGNVGTVTWVDEPCWPIDTTYYVETELPLRYVAERLRDTRFSNSHAAVPGLSRETAYRLPFLRPTDELMLRFGQIADDLGNAAKAMRGAVEKLSTVRDLLLPKLVTGQVDVSDLDLDELVGSVV